MSLIGQTIHGYEFQKQIGRGGFGAVYLARQETIGRFVAIKVILPQFASDPSFQQRFEVEAQLVASLEHPHIIPLYDYWQDETGAYLVMRYVPGGTLDDLLKKEEALSWEQARRIFLQLVEALEVAHDNSVIHRDIKPANILLDDRGNAYLTDFGVAWIVGNVSEKEGKVTGTIAYLAPELLKGGEPSLQSDLYALGILLYQMLVGTYPFVGGMAQIIQAHVNTPFPSILEVCPELPQDVEMMIYRLTMKDPKDRYRNIQSLREVLERATLSPDKKATATISIVGKAHGLEKSVRPHRNTLELRNRYSMIDAVYEYWIEGVLENLLSGYALLDLDLQIEPQYVQSDYQDDRTQEIADNANNILHIFESYSGKLLILGEPGVGKSTLLLALARELLHQANKEMDFPLPVILNLSSWAGNTTLVEWVENELNEKYQVPPAIAKRWIENDSLLLLLDGLDEVAEQHRQHCLDEINQWRDDHPFVDVVTSCRKIDYEALSTPLNLDGAVVIQPLNDEQVADYLNQIGVGTSAMQSMLAEHDEMRELSHSPLMLSVMITAYQDVTIEALPDFTSLGEQQHYLFDRYIDRVWHRRIAEKHFSLEAIRDGFSRIASNMYDRSQSMFFVEDLQPDWLPANNQRNFYIHHQVLVIAIFSLAWFVSSLLFLDSDEYLYYAVFGAIWGWVLFFGTERFGMIKSLLLFVVLVSICRITLDSTETIFTYFQKPLFRSTLPYTALLGTLTVLYRRTGQTSKEIHSVEALYFSIWSMRWIGAVAGMIGGLLVVVPNIVLGEGIELPIVILKIAVPGLLAWVITGFQSNQLQLSAGINEKIHRSFRNGLKMGLVGGVMVMLIVGTAFYPVGFDLDDGAPALFNILPFFMTTFFIYGGMVTLQHYLLRRQLTQQNVIPSDFVDLLKEGVQLGIIRRVGGGFIFIHRYLLEYFVALDNSKNSEN